MAFITRERFFEAGEFHIYTLCTQDHAFRWECSVRVLSRGKTVVEVNALRGKTFATFEQAEQKALEAGQQAIAALPPTEVRR